MPYDLFISYSRRDNELGRITQLVEHIQTDFAAFAGRTLVPFFDATEIHGMEDWRHRILQGLRESRLLLACLSPSYLQSEYCEWEFNEYLKYEIGRATFGDGVAPIYFVEVPGWEDKSFEQQCAAWVAELRRRQYFDLRPWFHAGEEALRDAIVQKRMLKLNEQLKERILRGERAEQSLGNVDAHNPHFIGRITELRRLRETVALGKVGVLTAVHGLGGIGKTAMAIEYAHAFAHEYGGGRWQVRCEGKEDLQAAIAELAIPLALEFNEDEKKNTDRQFQRVLTELRRLAETHEPQRCLLLLDNVDRPRLLEPAQAQRLPAAEWLHIIATTQLGESELHGKQKDRAFLPVDELPEADALQLIQTYQPGGTFPSDAEREAAREIVNLLGRFTLAVEAAAVYLAQFADDVTCAAFLARLEKERLEGLDTVAEQTSEGIRHGEKRLAATLAPTLDRLREPEKLALSYASLLPADHIALPWIRALVAEEFPEIGKDAEPGYPDPWKNLLRSLLSLRLLQVTNVMEGDGQPLVVRMHQLIGELLRKRIRSEEDTLAQRLFDYCLKVATNMGYNWDASARRWEILCLAKLADALMVKGDSRGPLLVSNLGFPLVRLSLGVDCVGLLSKALSIHPTTPEACTPEFCRLQYFLGELLGRLGRYDEAEPLIRQSLENRHRILGPQSHETWLSENNIGWLLMLRGDYTGAEPYILRARAGLETTLGATHYHTLAILNNVAVIESWRGNLAGAKELYERVFQGMIQVLGVRHPDTQYAACNLALILDRLGLHAEAKRLFEEAMANREAVLGEAHPETLESVSALATHYLTVHDPEKAEWLLHKLLELRISTLGWNHPDTLTSSQELLTVLEQMGRHEEAVSLMYRRIHGPGNESNLSPLAIRGLALDCFKLGYYNKAEELLNRLLRAGFEPAGTRHHLARLCLMTDRFAEAREQIAQAWAARTDAKPYIVARLLWFQLALELAEDIGQRSEAGGQQVANTLGMLKTALQAEGAHMEWTMDPVLDHLKSRLSAVDHALLTALVAALSNREKLDELNQFPTWREAEPLALTDGSM